MKFTSTKKQIHAAPVVLFHGQPNTGKSMASATAIVKGKPPLILLFEHGGTESLTEDNIRRVYGNRKDVETDIAVFECFDDGDVALASQTLEENKEEIVEKYGCIIVDSLSAAATIVLREAKNSGLTHGQQVYGMLAETVTEMVRSITKFCQENGMPVIFQAQSAWSEEPGTDGQILYPVFEGKKLLTAIPHEVSEVWATFVDGEGLDGKPVYGFQLLRDGNIFAKSRWGAVARVTGPQCHLGQLLEMKMGVRKVPADIRLEDYTPPAEAEPKKTTSAAQPAKTGLAGKPAANKTTPAK